MDLDFTGFVETECGKKFKLDVFEQLAIGVVQADNFLNEPNFVPATFSLYKTVTGLYLLETTRYNDAESSLNTSYKILSEDDAGVYLDNLSLGF